MNTRINFALFMLSGSAWCIAAVGIATLLAWWFLSDFYMMRCGSWWTEWMDRYAFMLASAVVILVLDLIGCIYLRNFSKRRLAGLGLRLIESTMAVQTWRNMIGEVSCREGGLCRKYLEWQSGRLARLDPTTSIDPKNIAGAWWFSLRAVAPVFLLCCWLPTLWASLVLIPQRTNVMEFLASAASGRANRMFDWRNSVEIAQNGRIMIVDEELQRDPRDGSLFRSATALLGRGSLTVRATDFPRVYRTIVAECAGVPAACAFSGIPGASKIAVPLRAGASRLDFIQPPSEIRLNMRLSFASRRDHAFDYVVVEPK